MMVVFGDMMAILWWRGDGGDLVVTQRERELLMVVMTVVFGDMMAMWWWWWWLGGDGESELMMMRVREGWLYWIANYDAKRLNTKLTRPISQFLIRSWWKGSPPLLHNLCHQYREDHDDNKAHIDQSEETEAWDSHNLHKIGLSYN